MALLKVNNLAKTFRSKNNENIHVLKDISFQANDGEFICILGPSGCGKTTILNAIAGLIDYEGEIFSSNNTIDIPPTIGYVFQTPRLLPWKSVTNNIEFALRAWGIPEEKRAIEIKNSLKKIGLSDFSNAYPHELSQGMQARIGLVRALATNPEILLMDEPFSHVDEITARSLRRELQAICEQTKPTVIFVTHNPREAAFLADRIYVLSQIPSQVTGELQIALARPRSPESSEIAMIVRQIYELLEKPKGESII